MSVREIVGRLTDAKNQIIQVKSIGDHSAATVAEAAHLVNRVLDGVQDKTLGTAIAEQSKAVADEFTQVLGLAPRIDDAIRKHRAIGSSGR
jgi:hypothetical protein